MLHYERGVEVTRRPWQRRIEVYSPKLRRRVTFLSQPAHEAWLLLESDPRVKQFCERPAYVEGRSGRAIDFWVSYGRHARFWMLSTDQAEHATLPKTVEGLALRIVRHEELVAYAMRIENWTQIVPYLVSFARHADGRLQQDILARLEKPHRMERLEAAFHPMDNSMVRAALFELLAAGKVVAPELDRAPLGINTVFKRAIG